MFENLNRRQFVKRSALFGAGVTLLGRSPLFALTSIDGSRYGALTSLALVDDTLHLVRADAGLSSILRDSLSFALNGWDRPPGNAAYFGHRMPAGPADVIGLIRVVKNGWSTRENDEKLDLKLALACGMLVQRSGAATIAPSLDGADDLTAAAAQQDAEVLRARSVNLDGAPGPAELESLFRQVVPRTMTRFHTNIPDYDDALDWVLRLQEWRRSHATQMAQYAAAFGDTSSSLYKRFVADVNFLDADDAAVQGADRVRRASEPIAADIADLAGGPARSLYGRALSDGLRQIGAVGAYLEGSLDEGDMSDQLAQR